MGLNERHFDRCDQGGSTEARPDGKMGNLRRWPPWHNSYVIGHLTTGVRKTLKHGMAKKRRQRDKQFEDSSENPS